MRFIIDEVCLEEDINTIRTSSDDKLPTTKKLKIGNW